MPYEKFPIKDTWQNTFKLWARNLEYLTKNLDSDNINLASLLKARSIKDYMIDFGTGSQQVDALNVPIVDSSSHYTSTSIENALAEVGLHKDTTNIHYLTSNISHTALLSIGTNSHADIDLHIASTTNPHGSAYTVGETLSTTLTGTTDLLLPVALVSDLNATNSIINQIRTSLINNGLLTT